VKNRKIFEKREREREKKGKKERKRERKEGRKEGKKRKGRKEGKKRERKKNLNPPPARAHLTYPRLEIRPPPLYPSPFIGQGRSPLDPHARRDA
jgi:hypothetical protein